MNLQSYISDIKTALSNVGDDPLPVVDGPVGFALNSQGKISQFICVSETEIGYERYNGERTYSGPIGIVIEIHVEKAAHDNLNRHLTRARNAFDDVWRAISGVTIAHYPLIREGGSRTETDDPSAVTYRITCVLETTEYESCQ
jgi:hypothetical protein